MFNQYLIFGPPLVLAVVLHEIAHGYAAYKLGDPTAKKLGRLSLNPLRHIDPVMTILLPGLLIAMHSPVVFGGAKPVPVNASYFKNPRRGMVLVAIAGPITNFVLLGLSYGLMLLLNRSSIPREILPASFLMLCLLWCVAGILCNAVLAIFNLIPLPPLDGGRVAVGLLPLKPALALARLEPWGFFILFGLLASGAVSSILRPSVNFVGRQICSELFEDENCPILGATTESEQLSDKPAPVDSKGELNVRDSI